MEGTLDGAKRTFFFFFALHTVRSQLPLSLSFDAVFSLSVRISLAPPSVRCLRRNSFLIGSYGHVVFLAERERGTDKFCPEWEIPESGKRALAWTEHCWYNPEQLKIEN